MDASSSVNSSFALDPQALAALKMKSNTAPKQALNQAASQFESVFMNMMLKSMRETLSQDGPFDSDSTRTYTSMLDQQLSQSLTSGANGGKGIGLAEMIVKQLSRQVEGASDADSTTGTNSTTSAIKGTGAAKKAKAAAVQAEIKQLQNGVSIATTPSTSGQAQSFIGQMMPYAKAAEDSTGVSSKFILAQAALESGWGRSEVHGADGASSHNLFGIKAGKDWKGAVVEAPTTEYVNGTPQRVTQRFRAYSSYADAFSDYAKLISSSARYHNVVAQGQSASGFALALQQSGYATDPAYASKINRIIQNNINVMT